MCCAKKHEIVAERARDVVSPPPRRYRLGIAPIVTARTPLLRFVADLLHTIGGVRAVPDNGADAAARHRLYSVRYTPPGCGEQCADDT